MDRSKGSLALVNYPVLSRMQDKFPDRYNNDFIVFNRDGTRLATVVSRECHSILGAQSNKHADKMDVDDNNSEEEEEEEETTTTTESKVQLVTLQLWHFSNGSYVMNTRIESPHGDKPLKVCFVCAF